MEGFPGTLNPELQPLEEVSTEEFDDDFFAGLEQDMADIDVAQLASEALAGILTVQAEDGQTRSYETIKKEADVFFANPAVAKDMRMLAMLTKQYEDFCADHGTDSDSSTSSSPSNTFSSGGQAGGHGGHSHGGGHEHHSGKAKNKSKKKKQSFWAYVLGYEL